MLEVNMSKKVAPRRVIYYEDELNDDFAATKELGQNKIDEYFNYQRMDNPFIRLWANFLYFIIVKPLVFLALKIYFHYRVIGKKKMRKRGKRGCFIYGNHTNYLPDAAFNSMLHAGRNYVVVGPQTVSIRGIGGLVQDLGAIPLADTLVAKANYMASIRKKLKQNASITIYPEAHIWPYYQSVRPFGNASFLYPVEENVPVYSVATCYQKRKHAFRPKIVFVVDGPFYPDPILSRSENMKKLRDEVYYSLLNATKRYSTYEFYKYIKKEEEDVSLA